MGPCVGGGGGVLFPLNTLVTPVLGGGGGGVLLVLVDVDLEALAIAFVLPVSDRVADAIEERTASEIEPPNEHSTQMADVTHVISGRPKQQGKKKLHCGQQEHKRAQGHSDRQEKNANPPVR